MKTFKDYITYNYKNICGNIEIEFYFKEINVCTFIYTRNSRPDVKGDWGFWGVYEKKGLNYVQGLVDYHKLKKWSDEIVKDVK